MLGLAVCSAASAGPPYATDDPEPPPLHHLEVILATEWTHDGGGSSGSAPVLELNYGAFDDAQFGISLPLAWSAPVDGSPAWGLGDIGLGFKYRLVEEGEGHPAVCLFPSWRSASGRDDRGLGAGAAEWFLPVWISRGWREWRVGGGGGLRYSPADAARAVRHASVLLERDLAPRLRIGGELVADSAAATGEQAELDYRFGAVYALAPGYQWLLSAGGGLHGNAAARRHSVYVGLQISL